ALTSRCRSPNARQLPDRQREWAARCLHRRVAARRLLDLALLGHLRQLRRDTVALQIEPLGQIARGAVGMLAEVVDDACGSVSLTGAGGLARVPRTARSGAAVRAGRDRRQCVGGALLEGLQLRLEPIEPLLRVIALGLEGCDDLLHA